MGKEAVASRKCALRCTQTSKVLRLSVVSSSRGAGPEEQYGVE